MRSLARRRRSWPATRLLAQAFEVLATGIQPPAVAARCCARTGSRGGASNLVGGQEDDLEAEFAEVGASSNWSESIAEKPEHDSRAACDWAVSSASAIELTGSARHLWRETRLGVSDRR